MLFNQPCFRLNLDGCHFFRYSKVIGYLEYQGTNELNRVSTVDATVEERLRDEVDLDFEGPAAC